MINVKQFRELIVKPTLEFIGLYSPAAENLMVGTALVESRIQYLKQKPNGPALSVFQVEPATHDDLWAHFLLYMPHIREKVLDLVSHRATYENDKLSDMIGNLPYACAMARLVYYRKPEPLPHAQNIMGLAQYWKKHYNTEMGKGDPISFFEMYNAHAR